MACDRRHARRRWLWLAGAAWLGSASASAAQSPAVAPACRSTEVYLAVRQHRMPDAVGCPALLVARAFREFQLPLRIDGENSGTPAYPTYASPSTDRPVVSQDPAPGMPLAGVTAEISLVAPSSASGTTSGATLPAAVPTVAVTAARALAGEPLVFRVTLAATGDMRRAAATYAAASGSARAGIDFAAANGNIVLVPGVPLTVQVATTPAPPGTPARSMTLGVGLGGATVASGEGTIVTPAVPSPAVAFAISSPTQTVVEGATFAATITRTGALERRQAIGAILVDRAACPGTPVRRGVVFQPGEQAASVAFVICRAAPADVPRTVSIVLQRPPRGSVVAAGEVDAVVTPSSAPPSLWTAAAAVGGIAATAMAIRRFRFRRRWRRARPTPFTVTARCRVAPATATPVGRAKSGPAIAIDVAIAVDSAVVDRPAKETG